MRPYYLILFYMTGRLNIKNSASICSRNTNIAYHHKIPLEEYYIIEQCKIAIKYKLAILEQCKLAIPYLHTIYILQQCRQCMCIYY